MNAFEGVMQIIELKEQIKKLKDKLCYIFQGKPELIYKVCGWRTEMDKDYFSVTLYIKRKVAKEILSKEVYNYYEEQGKYNGRIR